MKRIVRTVFGVTALASAVLPASAINYTLNVANQAVSPYPAPYATVNVTLNDSTDATVTFTGLTTGGFTYVFGSAQALDVNVNTVGGLNVGFSVSAITGMTGPGVGSGNASAFGNFNLTIDNSDGASDAASPMSFKLHDLSGTWLSDANVLDPNGDGFLAAAHVFILNSAGAVQTTGFVGNGPSPRTVPDGGSTVLLLGGALAGIGLLRRKMAR